MSLGGVILGPIYGLYLLGGLNRYANWKVGLIIIFMAIESEIVICQGSSVTFGVIFTKMSSEVATQFFFDQNTCSLTRSRSCRHTHMQTSSSDDRPISKTGLGDFPPPDISPSLPDFSPRRKM